MTLICKIESCHKEAKVKGFCRKHYHQDWWNKNRVSDETKQQAEELEEWESKYGKTGKRCKTCGEIKGLDKFYKRKMGQHRTSGSCKECRKQIIQTENMKYHKAYEPIRIEKEKELLSKAYAVYGNRCEACGQSAPEVLQFHHRKPVRYKKNPTRGSVEENKEFIKVANSGKRLPGLVLLCAHCHLKFDRLDGTALRNVVMERVTTYLNTGKIEIPKHKCQTTKYSGKTKRCSRCKEYKYVELFDKKGKHRASHCKACRSTQKKTKEVRQRAKVVEIYDNKCCMCGSNDIASFQFHHTNGVGGAENRKLHNRSRQVVKRILDKGSKLEDIKILCANCHIKADLLDGTNRIGSLRKGLRG